MSTVAELKCDLETLRGDLELYVTPESRETIRLRIDCKLDELLVAMDDGAQGMR